MKSILTHAIIATMTLILLTLAWLLLGCQADDSIVMPNPQAKAYPLAMSADQLMANFMAAYGTRDLEGFAATLHRDFVFELDPSDVALGQPASWGRDEELRITANMFSGHDRVKDGVTIAGIDRIVFVRCEAQGPWTVVTTAAGTREVLSRTYAVQVRFERSRDVDLEVRGLCIFEVVRDDIVSDGEVVQPGYQILRWLDRTG